MVLSGVPLVLSAVPLVLFIRLAFSGLAGSCHYRILLFRSLRLVVVAFLVLLVVSGRLGLVVLLGSLALVASLVVLGRRLEALLVVGLVALGSEALVSSLVVLGRLGLLVVVLVLRCLDCRGTENKHEKIRTPLLSFRL